VHTTQEEIQRKALSEFNYFVKLLMDIGVEVVLFEDTISPVTPDSIFPNNWFSTHSTGQIITYPMQPESRRGERRKDLIEELQKRFNYTQRINLENNENCDEPKYLEGTGSMVFDHQNKVVYAALSPRTNENILNELSEIIDYKTVSFRALGSLGEEIYHTNVMMCIGESFVVLGDKTIHSNQRDEIVERLQQSGKEIIYLSNDQVYNSFAGNMLQLRNNADETVLVMSQAAYDSLEETQINDLLKHNDHLLSVPLDTIEKIGGGSARCMLAEIFTTK